MGLTKQQKIANEKHFVGFLKMGVKNYMWIDKCEILDMSTGLKIKPKTLKGYIELAGITRKEFMDIFVDCPDDYDKARVNKILKAILREGNY
jgi:hypothetical protein